MKPLMNLMIVGLVINMSCNSSVSYEEALNKNKDRFEDARQFEDARFLVNSKSRNQLTIKILTLAADSGYSSLVVNFAKQNLPQYQQLDQEIEDLSDKKDITLPGELSGEHQRQLSQLTASKREDFDNTFSQLISDITKENNSMFTSQATEASDADIRAFAARKLDLLRNHSQLLSTMQNQLLDTSQ